MRKEEFLQALAGKLRGLPQEDIQRFLAYYEEMLADKIEEGMDEEKAIADMGSVEEIAAQILSEIPLKKLVGERFKDAPKMNGWTVALLILGSPLWISFLATALSLVLTAFVLVWLVPVVWCALLVALAAAGVGGVGVAVIQLFVGNGWSGAFTLGCGLVCIGLAILFFFGNKILRWTYLLNKKFVLWSKRKCMKKEASK